MSHVQASYNSYPSFIRPSSDKTIVDQCVRSPLNQCQVGRGPNSSYKHSIIDLGSPSNRAPPSCSMYVAYSRSFSERISSWDRGSRESSINDCAPYRVVEMEPPQPEHDIFSQTRIACRRSYEKRSNGRSLAEILMLYLPCETMS